MADAAIILQTPVDSARPSPAPERIGLSVDIEPFLTRLLQWARQRPDIAVIALVGSHARGQARPDSDIDLLLLVENPQVLLEDTAWVRAMGRPLRQEVEDWGKVTSLRVWYADGREVEYGLTGLDWGSDPADEGDQRVMADGIKVLYQGAPQCIIGQDHPFS